MDSQSSSKLKRLRARIDQLKSPEKAKIYARFFKTGPGQYGEGDQFLGLTMPQNRDLVREFYPLNQSEQNQLLESPWHELRMIGLLLLVEEFEGALSSSEQKRVLQRYLKLRSAINNWDLVDVTAPKILGVWSLTSGSTNQLEKLARSKRHWDRRMAVVGSLALIKAGSLDWIYRVVELRMNDEEDLMRKAMGWMLREAGKKDLIRLKQFLRRHIRKLPRTTLRYAIERFPEAERKAYLKL